jgi:hypothetical protein
MARSDLIVLLPIVAAIAGAFFGAAANGLVGAWQSWRFRVRERKGLLRLLDGEIYYNETLLKQLKKNPSLIVWSSMGSLRSGNWDSAKTRLAQLIDLEHTKALNTYYSHVKTLVDAIDHSRSSDENKVAAVLAGVEPATRHGRNARRYGQRYLKDPNFVDAVPTTQGQASETGHSVSLSFKVAYSRQDLLTRLRDDRPKEGYLLAAARNYVRQNPDDAEVRQALDCLPEDSPGE